MDLKEIEKLLYQGFSERKHIIVKYNSGKSVKGWLQKWDPNTTPSTFIMMVDSRYARAVDYDGLLSVTITDEYA